RGCDAVGAEIRGRGGLVLRLCEIAVVDTKVPDAHPRPRPELSLDGNVALPVVRTDSPAGQNVAGVSGRVRIRLAEAAIPDRPAFAIRGRIREIAIGNIVVVAVGPRPAGTVHRCNRRVGELGDGAGADRPTNDVPANVPFYRGL